MRLLTTLQDETSAKTLGDALYSQGMETTIKETREGGFSVWVHDEERMDEARAFLNGFDPSEGRFSQMAREARAQRRQERKEARALQERAEKMRRQFEARQRIRIGSVTLGLIVISAIVFVVTDLGRDFPMRRFFQIVDIQTVGNQLYAKSIDFTVTHQPWRLITPIFLHGGGDVTMGLLHLGFNMWWLKDLGTVIERFRSPIYLLALVVVSGVLSNLFQYYMVGPFFGGMSGVVYALFAFLWIRGRFDPMFPFRMPPGIVTFLLVWLVLGFAGFMNMANYAHLGGLLVGAAWGFLSSGYLRRKMG